MVIYISSESITKKEVKKYLYISIFYIVFMPFLIVLIPLLLSSLPARIPSDVIFTIEVPLIIWLFIIMTQGIVSLVFYFVNYEIMYGMWRKKKRKEKIENRNLRIGKRIQLLIVIPGVVIHVIFLFFTFYLLSLTLS